MTEHGRIADLRISADKITKESKEINFSTLHGKGTSLARAGLLKIDHWETAQFIGPILERLPYYNGEMVPGGIIFDKGDEYDNQSVEVDDHGSEEPMIGFVANTPFAYDLAEQDSTREIRMLIPGTIAISRQRYDTKHPIEIGVIVKKATSTTTSAQFIKGVFINTEAHIDGSNYTNVHDDHKRMLFHTNDVVNADDALEKLDDEGLEDDQTFSYVSNFQIAVNLSSLQYLLREHVEPLHTDDPNRGKATNFKVLVALRKHDIKVNVSVQTPVIEISIVSAPLEMKYLGLKYSGSVLDLLGEVPEWYQTEDPHDPLNIYQKLMASIVLRAGRISELHVKDGAAYSLTKLHIQIARSESGLSQLTDTDLDEHIRLLIVTCAKWMYNTSMLQPYRLKNRKHLFMRLIETVAFQCMYHVSLISQSYQEVITEYLRDCNEYNLYEIGIDKQTIKAVRNRL